MFTKSDGDFLVLDDVIILYKGKGTKVTFPAVVDGHHIKAIGNGAVSGREDIEEIVVERGIKDIGNSSFTRMLNLKKLELPDTIKNVGRQSLEYSEKINQIDIPLYLSEEEYEKLYNDSCGDDEGNRFCGSYIKEFPFYSVLKGAIIAGRSMYEPCAVVDSRVRSLVACQRVDKEHEMRTNLNLAGGSSFTDFDEVTIDSKDLLEKIALFQEKKYLNPDTNRDIRYNDRRYLKNERYRELTTFILMFNEDNVIRENGQVVVRIEAIMGVFYWNALRKMVMDGTSYYYMDRYYLTSNEDSPYRRDFNGKYYDESGNEITDSNIIHSLDIKRKIMCLL